MRGGKSGRDYFRRRGFWVALLASSALASVIVQPEAAPVGQTAVIAYSISAGPLNEALAAFGKQSGLQISYVPSIAIGKSSPGINGRASAGQALARILSGTGLSYAFQNSATVSIAVRNAGDASSAVATVPGAMQLDMIDVLGGNPNSTMTPPPALAGGQVGSGSQMGLLGNRSVMDTPFNQTSYTSQTIVDQQARNLADVLLNDPSVNIATSVASGTTSLYIRGFVVGLGDTGFNGLYGVAPSYNTTPYFMERVEVLKGPGALLNGMPPGGAIGGSVNIVPKRASDVPLTRFTTSYVSRGQFIEHADIGRRFGQDNAFGVRVNGVYSKGDTSVVGNRTEFGLFTLGLDYRSDRVRLSTDFGYQNQVTKSSMRYVAAYDASIGAFPAAPSASKTYTPPWEYARTQDIFGTIQGEVDLNEATTAYAILGGRRSTWSYLYATPNLTSSAGDITARNEAGTSGNESVAAQSGVRTRFETGPVKHALSFNASANNQVNYSSYQGGVSFATNIYRPSYGLPTAFPTGRRPKTGEVRLGGIGVADTVSAFDERVQLTVGVRRQQVQTVSFSSSTGLLTSSYGSGAWSPAYALVVKPWKNVSLYANYIEGLQAGTTVGVTYANAGTVLPPYQSKQVETGVKVDWGSFITTLSLFQIEQPNTIATSSGGLAYLRLDGQQRNRGIEINTAGELTEGVRLIGGAMILDPRLTRTANGTNDNNMAPGVARFQLNLGAEWDTPFLPGFTLNGRAVHMSGQFVNVENTLAIPDWNRFDLGARYKFAGPWNKPVTMRFNVENILDKNAWAYVYYNGVSMMQPRTFVLSATMDF